MNVQIEESWKQKLGDEFEKDYFKKLVEFLKYERQLNHVIYPKGQLIFNAFQQTPFDKVKVVLIGQDPYHGEGQAMGMSFSVPDGVKIPPSLVNIYKELKSDIGLPIPQSGNLTKWAQQGVLLLNATLTVRANEANSHSRAGWTNFTDRAIEILSEQKEHLVFLLWGKFAQEKRFLIDFDKHLVLMAAHPSPLSAHNGFFGCQHFSKTNRYLIDNGIDPINWKP